jgi:Cu+-exporting ATPase
VTGAVEGRSEMIGSPSHLEDSGIDPGDLPTRAGRSRRDDRSVVLFAIDGRAVGLIGVADPVKGSAADVVAQLHRAGLHVVC